MGYVVMNKYVCDHCEAELEDTNGVVPQGWYYLAVRNDSGLQAIWCCQKSCAIAELGE